MSYLSVCHLFQYYGLAIQIVNSFSQNSFIVIESAQSEIAIITYVTAKLVREMAMIQYPIACKI